MHNVKQLSIWKKKLFHKEHAENTKYSRKMLTKASQNLLPFAM